MYMLYDMFDPVNGLSWRKMPRCNMLIKEKENFKTHVHRVLLYLGSGSDCYFFQLTPTR